MRKLDLAQKYYGYKAKHIQVCMCKSPQPTLEAQTDTPSNSAPFKNPRWRTSDEEACQDDPDVSSITTELKLQKFNYKSTKQNVPSPPGRTL